MIGGIVFTTNISIHALLAESDAKVWICTKSASRFLSTLSLRRATTTPLPFGWWEMISIHALLAESDLCSLPSAPMLPGFLSTLSLRRATSNRCGISARWINFYPRSPCGERQPLENHTQRYRRFLSTLSLRRATSVIWLIEYASSDFYPRSPCGERRCRAGHPSQFPDFYPRSPCGERQGIPSIAAGRYTISIHALLAESDGIQLLPCDMRMLFLSTLSLRRATHHKLKSSSRPLNFYPRSPCGERLASFMRWVYARLFLSTLSLRRATGTVYHIPRRLLISIHALLAESDRN